jgi:hypothetical protein
MSIYDIPPAIVQNYTAGYCHVIDVTPLNSGGTADPTVTPNSYSGSYTYTDSTACYAPTYDEGPRQRELKAYWMAMNVGRGRHWLSGERGPRVMLRRPLLQRIQPGPRMARRQAEPAGFRQVRRQVRELLS